MKKVLALCVMMAVVLVSGPAMAGMGLPGLSKSAAPAVDVNALTARSAAVKRQVTNATIALGSGLVEVMNACGKKTEAAKLQATIDASKSNKDDIEKTKQLIAEVNTASNETSKIDLQSKMDQSAARSSLGKSILFLGAGAISDLSAVAAAKVLVTDLTTAISSVKSAPASYGPSALTNLAAALDAAKFIVENVPPQVVTTQELTKGLVKYAQTNKIPIPSQADMEKSAKDMEKG